MDDIEILEQQAIDSAINLQWETAIDLNKQILKIDKENVDACLRLGFAYLQIKDIQEAQKYYNKSLKLRPKNQVALENLERLAVMEMKDHPSHKKGKEGGAINPTMFLEVPGKTKAVNLVNLGQKKHLATVTVGQEVELKQKKRKIEVRTTSGEYLGSLPDDLSKRMIFFLKNKSEYKANIQEASLTKIVIFIQEVLKGKKVMQYTSFPANIQNNLDQMEDGEEIAEGEEDSDVDELESMAEKISDREEDANLLSGMASDSDEDTQDDEE